MTDRNRARLDEEIVRLRAINADATKTIGVMIQAQHRQEAKLVRLEAINVELVEALKALHLAFLSVPFKASPRQMPAIRAASERAFAAIIAAEKG